MLIWSNAYVYSLTVSSIIKFHWMLVLRHFCWFAWKIQVLQQGFLMWIKCFFFLSRFDKFIYWKVLWNILLYSYIRIAKDTWAFNKNLFRLCNAKNVVCEWEKWASIIYLFIKQVTDSCDWICHIKCKKWRKSNKSLNICRCARFTWLFV